MSRRSVRRMRCRDHGAAVRGAVAVLRAAMNDAGVTQVAVARALGVSEATVSRALSGKVNLTLRSIQAIAGALGKRAVVVVTD